LSPWTGAPIVADVEHGEDFDSAVQRIVAGATGADVSESRLVEVEHSRFSHESAWTLTFVYEVRTAVGPYLTERGGHDG
jgi:hypothetical protein